MFSSWPSSSSSHTSFPGESDSCLHYGRGERDVKEDKMDEDFSFVKLSTIRYEKILKIFLREIVSLH